MPVTPLTNTPAQQGSDVRSTTPDGPTQAAAAKQRLNVQIMETSASVSLSSGDDSQALLLRSAIDRINELLAPEFGENAIQNASAEDNSPEATADRILSLSTGFYEAYAAQRKGDDPAQVAQDFVDLIRGGFEKGFTEARDILQGMGAFSEEGENNIMKTYDLVQKGYVGFLAAKLAAGQPSPESPASA